jgi:hypothetical protein
MRKLFKTVWAYFLHDLTVITSWRYRFQESKDRYYNLDCFDIQ